MPYRLAGIATLDSGDAALRVVVRDWTTHAHAGVATPAGDGSWSIVLPDSGPFDVTTFGPEGFQPVTHGPLTAAEIA